MFKFQRQLNIEQGSGGASLVSLANAGQEVPRPERILNALVRLNENIHDTISTIRGLKKDFVGDPATVRDEATPEEKQMSPDNFMDRIEQIIALCEESHEKLTREANDFKNKSMA